MLTVFYALMIYPLTQIIEFVFVFAQKLFKETGISIICVSGAFSALCLPLYVVAEGWQEKERVTQKRLKPKIDKIKAVFKGDERYMILSAYYRQNRYHPVYALRSSFGLLIQIPFFIAAYSYLSHLEALRGASFLFIQDLGRPDGMLSILRGGITFNVLPVIMTGINIISGTLYAKKLGAKDKIQLYGMAVLFLALLYNSPAGLVLYWTMNNIFSLAKNIYYAIPVKGKHYWLTAFFSLSCILLAAFCAITLGYNSKAQKLAVVFVCVFSATAPWAALLFRKRITKTINIKYENGKTAPVFFASILLLWTLFGLFIPSQLIAASPQEFSFIDGYTNPLAFTAAAAVQSFGLFVFWPSACFFLFSPKTKNYLSLAFFCLCLGVMLNVFVFPGDYGVISVSFVYNNGVGHSLREIAVNTAALIAVFSAAIFLYAMKNKKIALVIPPLCALSLLSISLVNFHVINSEFSLLQRYYVKEDKKQEQVNYIASLSRTGKNVVLIMLDRAISGFVPFIFDEYPGLREKYSGFVFYPNTVSFNGYTSLGAPPVFGGYEYTPEEINKRDAVPLVEKHNESLLMLPRVFLEHGFSVCVTDPPYANYNQKSDLSIFAPYKNIQSYITDSKYTDIWIEEHGLKLPEQSAIIKRNMLWYSLLKGLPLFMRQPVYADGHWCSPFASHSLRLTLNGYSALDYLPRLIGLSGEEKNTALIMTNNATHEGSLLQAPDYRPVINVTNYGTGPFAKEPAYHINAAALKRLSEWFDLLKKENVYGNTRIILVSDHGQEPIFITKTGLPFNVDQFNPLLMVKDFNASGAVKTDMAFMSNADAPSLALKDLIDGPKNPFTGQKISMERKKDPLYIAISGSIHLSGKSATQFALNPKRDYYVKDNIFDPANWTAAEY
jgi:YidC/Oxa1 family membrane protein insertase